MFIWSNFKTGIFRDKHVLLGFSSHNILLITKKNNYCIMLMKGFAIQFYRLIVWYRFMVAKNKNYSSLETQQTQIILSRRKKNDYLGLEL